MSVTPADLAAALHERYRFERELGRGGMATVFLAEDLKHHRRVAVKVLHPDLAGALGAERFLREIATVAALRHPHILPLYDSGRIPPSADGDGALYQVMPLAEGESLRDLLRREGRLDIDHALRIAAEMADALSYAHRNGVVHRDIKPENVLLESGHAVVADFGIARAIDAASGERLTATGLSLGTPQYMSPEQAAGDQEIDGRSDIYALGCVLYEMLTGEPPFTGPSVASVLRQHLLDDPPSPDLARPELASDVAALVARSLAKLPAERWQDAAELRAALDAARARHNAGAQPTQPERALETPRSRRRWMLVAIAVGVVGVVALAGTLLRRRGPPELRIGRRSQVTLAPGLEVHPALSPDGALLAYSAGADARLYVRQVDGGAAIPVARDLPGPQGWPQWAPDGKQLTFSSTRGLEIVPALGGAPRLLVPAPIGVSTKETIVVGGPWSPDGREVSFVRGDTLYAVRASGGVPRAVASAEALHSCAWSHDGSRIACVSGNHPGVTLGPLLGNIAPSAIVIVPAGGGVPTRLVADSSANASPAWLPDGTLLFVSNREGGREVFAARVARDGSAIASSQRVTTGLSALSITVPTNGSRIGYAAFSETSNVWSLPIPARGVGAIAEAQQVTSGSQVIEFFDISRDGRWILFDSDRSGNGDIYRMPLDGGAEPEQLTRGAVDEFYPNWSPDAREIAFHSFDDGRRQLQVMPAEGGPSRLVARTDGDDRAPVWTPDGRGLTFLTNFGHPDMATRVVRRDASGRWSAPAVWRRPGCMVTWSPDGSAAACGDLEGRVLLLDPRGGLLRVLADSGIMVNIGLHPHWSADGRTVYYIAADSVSTNVSAVPAAGGPPRIVVRFDDRARPWHRFGFDIANDRLYFTLGGRESHIWVAELAKPE